MVPIQSVPVGTTTKAGYAATIVGLIGTILAVAFDLEEQDAAIIAGAVWTIVSFAITQIGRYMQARELAKAQAISSLASRQP